MKKGTDRLSGDTDSVKVPLTAEQLLVARIRRGDADAWDRLIALFEGRLLAFCESRLGRGPSGEDIVQETFIGFLTSLPNYDARRSLEGYLFSICAYKLVDHMRREGRRPALPFSVARGDARDSFHIPDAEPSPSAGARSQERRHHEEAALVDALRPMLDHWRQRGDWQKLKCLELLFVRGRSNKDTAQRLGLTEQQVANYKSDFVIQLRKVLRRQDLDATFFPELHTTATE
ncbi:MAG TPA: sigma-70 family RNA polymerase sigma factor [Pirellulaceae bacterium]